LIAARCEEKVKDARLGDGRLKVVSRVVTVRLIAAWSASVLRCNNCILKR
jgi:hypothetical protein